MKIPSSYLREKLGSLLNAITYDDGEGFNGTVPVVASEGAESKYQIFIGSYSDASRSNKKEFAGRARQDIEVVEMDARSRRFTHVDAIGELAANDVHPTVGSNLLSNTDFSILIVGKPSVNHLSESSGDGSYINRLILSFDLLINEN